MKLTVTVCDVCQDKDRPTKRYEIKHDDGKVPVDLCDEHAQPLFILIQAARSQATRTPATGIDRPRRGTRPRVTTVEEIERSKTQ